MGYFAWIDGERKDSWVIIERWREIVERLEADIAMLQGPFVIRLEKSWADQPQDRCFILEDTNDVSTVLSALVPGAGDLNGSTKPINGSLADR